MSRARLAPGGRPARQTADRTGTGAGPANAAGLLRLQADAGNRATSSALHVQRGIPGLAVQRFGVDERTWNEVTSVKLLDKDAYEVSTRKHESVVIKKSGMGELAYVPNGEAPVQEALAAQAGEIAAPGMTARTVVIETAGEEGQLILKHLAKLNAAGRDLAQILAGTAAFLVMERAPGEPANKARQIVAASSRKERTEIFYRLGRLWAFDLLIDNTDRFVKMNWGNVIVGPGGTVTGIDQMIGPRATNDGADMGTERATEKLKILVDPVERRKQATEIFDSLVEHLDPDIQLMRTTLMLHFERGALEGARAAAAVTAKDLEQKQTELPGSARKVAAEIGPGGVAAIAAVFAGSDTQIAGALTGLRADITKRADIDGAIAPAGRERAAILTTLGGTANKLLGEWSTVDKLLLGRDFYWKKRVGGLASLPDLGRAEFEKATKVNAADEIMGQIRAQLQDWREGLETVRRAMTDLLQPLEDPHAEMKPLIDALVKAVHQEATRPPIHERG